MKNSRKALEKIILKILSERKSGLSEYELIQELQERGFFPEGSFAENLPLFQMHFLLFHSLYRLRNRLWKEERGHLVVKPLEIALKPYKKEVAALAETDALREYYLDLDNLQNTTEEDLEELLGKFWVKFFAGERRKEALETMKLEETADYETVKQQYRRLVKQFHPDLGGDEKRLQEINEAMDILKQYFA